MNEKIEDILGKRIKDQHGCFDIGWMVRRHLSSVICLDHQCFHWPWDEHEFTRFLRQRNSIGMAAVYEGTILGYMVYELFDTVIEVGRLGVDPDFFRCQIGTALVEKLISKLSTTRRHTISIYVRESNLSAQLFFRQMGFRCVATVKDWFPENGESAFRFVYSFKR